MQLGLAWRIGADGVLALLPAALWAVALVGRTEVTGITVSWASTLIAGWCVMMGWVGWCRLKSPAGIGLIPVAALSAAVLVVLYLSDTAHHQWVFASVPKALVLSASALLVWYAGTLRPAL